MQQYSMDAIQARVDVNRDEVVEIYCNVVLKMKINVFKFYVFQISWSEL